MEAKHTPGRRRVGHYGAAILWIAQNDDTEWLEKMDAGEVGWSLPSHEIALYVVCIVAFAVIGWQL